MTDDHDDDGEDDLDDDELLDRFLDTHGPDEHEDWEEWASAGYAGCWATIGAIGDQAFVLWQTPEGVDSGREPWDGARQSAGTDVAEYVIDLGVSQGFPDPRGALGLANDAASGAALDGAVQLGTLGTAWAGDREDFGYGRFDLYLRRDEGDIVVVDGDDDVIVGGFPDLDAVLAALMPPRDVLVRFAPRWTGDDDFDERLAEFARSVEPLGR